MAALQYPPNRGRIIIVNFELAGTAVVPEIVKARPCLVVQNNGLLRGPLVTVVPLSTTPPRRVMPYHHKMDHRSFRDLPADYGGQAMERWAKCDYVATVSLDRCVDPYSRPPHQARRYVKVKAIQADIEAVEKCILWALGIDPKKHA